MAELLSTNLATSRDYVNTVRFLVWNQFPAILERSIRYFATLPQVGVYKQTNPNIVDFKRALLDTLSRQFTMSGIGSLIDFERYGNEIKKPTPNYYGTGCSGNTLCLEPTCFGFTEGVMENVNQIVNLCWSLSMPCLKDQLYSDMMFEQKLQSYFKMFFAQAPGVLQAYQRTHLLQNAYKIVATSQNYNYTGPVIGGTGTISLPFYVNPADPLSFPDLTTITQGIGGANLDAFANFLAPRLFSGNFEGGMNSVTVYGQPVDWEIAKEQTMSVQDHRSDSERVESRLDRLMGAGLTADGLFPTFATENGVVYPITAEVLQPATIAGYVQTTNPDHALQEIRGLLFVPSNWKYNLIQPPVDDFSYLGVGPGLNFRENTPGVFPVPMSGGTYLSSSLFRNNTMDGGTVILGSQVVNGQVIPTASGMRGRERPLAEAVRTRIIMTYAQQTCGTNIAAPVAVTQGEADGFDLKSTMYIGTDVQGSARPVLLLFKTDTPRSAQPITVCSTETVTVTGGGELFLSGCCVNIPANTATLAFTADGLTTAQLNAAVAAAYTVGDTAVYRVGPKGESFVVEITAVSGNMVAITAVDGNGDPDLTIELLCCSGVPDDYGVLGELLVVTGTTDTCSEIKEAVCDSVTGILSIELYNPIIASADANEATITLISGEEILVVYSAAADAGVFITVEAAVGETCVLCDMDCGCLQGAQFCITAET